MCNLYNVTTSQEAIRQWTRALRDILGNLEPSIDIYPNMPGPVVRNASHGEREIACLLWGMPTPPERVKGKADYGTTNIRNPQYGHWQQFVGVEHRCVVPVTSFAEPSPTAGDKDPETGIQRNYWFALSEDRPLFFFAGLWTRWEGVRK
ncbi:MAG: SOS response-associated peptidase, partial [Mesorhizobium sp.]